MKVISLYIYKYISLVIITFFILLANIMYNYYGYFEFIYNLSYLYFFTYYFIIKMQTTLYILTYIINIWIIKVLCILIMPLLIIIKIGIKLIKIMIMIFLSIIPGIRVLFTFMLNIIIFFVDLITHNYAFMWGDWLFKYYYNIEIYGKIIIFFCELITSIVVYVLYILYIPAIALFFIYHILFGYTFWLFILFWFPIISIIPKALIWWPIWGTITWLMDAIETEKLFLSWVILYLLPGTYFALYRELVSFVIEVYMDSKLYLTQNPDAEFVRKDHRQLCREYRAVVVKFFCFCFLIIQGFKLIFIKLGIPLCFQYSSQYTLFVIINISLIYLIWDTINDYKEYFFFVVYEEYFLDDLYFYDILDEYYTLIENCITNPRLLKKNYESYN